MFDKIVCIMEKDVTSAKTQTKLFFKQISRVQKCKDNLLQGEPHVGFHRITHFKGISFNCHPYSKL